MGVQFSRSSADDKLGFPPEIIEEICSFLSMYELLHCRRVCQQWNQSVLNYKIHPRNVKFMVHGVGQLDVLTSPMAKFLRKFAFHNASVPEGRMIEFWEANSQTIITLDLIDSNVNAQACRNSPAKGVLQCPHLKNVSVIGCDLQNLLATIRFIDDWVPLENIHNLDLSNNKHLSDQTLMALLWKTKTLKSLNLSNCQINSAPPIFYRFYPNNRDRHVPPEHYSDLILTFQILVMGYLDTPRAAHLVELILDHNNLDDAAIASISNPAAYNWKSISLNTSYSHKETKGLISLLERQKLKKFRFGFNSISSLPTNGLAPLLGELELLDLGRVQVKLLEGFPDCFPYLTHLYLSHTLVHVKKGEFSSVFPVLTHLDMSFTDYKPIFLVDYLGSATKLIDLNLSNCPTAVTDEVVQALIGSNRWLQKLDLTSCVRITDLGIAGRLLTDDAEVFPNEPAWKKRAMLEWKANPVSGHCLSSLSGLQVLRLSGCKELGQATFQSALNLPHLQALDLSFVEIGYPGFLSILKKCPSLVSLRYNSMIPTEAQQEALDAHPYLTGYTPKILTAVTSVSISG